MEKKAHHQWIIQGKKYCKNYVFFQNRVLNLDNFLEDHPGGVQAIKNYILKDITNILFEVFPHKRQAVLPILLRYQIGSFSDEQAPNEKQKNEKMLINKDKLKQKKKVCFNPNRQNVTLSMMANQQTKLVSLNQNSQLPRFQYNSHNSVSKPKSSRSNKSNKKRRQNLTSIRIIKDEVTKLYEDQLKENKKKKRAKQQALKENKINPKQKRHSGAYSFQANEIDEGKPLFRVPVLNVKNMNRFNY